MVVGRVALPEAGQGCGPGKIPRELVELWGLTEGVATTLKPEDMQEKTASIGIPPV